MMVSYTMEGQILKYSTPSCFIYNFLSYSRLVETYGILG